MIKTYKTIFRIDYPLSYKLIDEFGKILSHIHDETSLPPFIIEKRKGEISLAQNVASYYGETALVCFDNDEKRFKIVEPKVTTTKFNLNINLTSFNGVVEFVNGCDLKDVTSQPIFKIVDEILKKVFNDNTVFDRIGVRNNVIISHENHTFDDILASFCNFNSNINNIMISFFTTTKDIAITFEHCDDLDCSRLQLGPYNDENEWYKYFTQSTGISNGIIFDIDLFRKNSKINYLSLKKIINHYSHMSENIIDKLSNKLLTGV